MKKYGRNEPCPCGSGKKYKKCCLLTDKAPVNSALVYTDLDDLSNQVTDLIDQEKYAEAEAVCVKLMEQYPEQIDGLHRYAQLFEAQGEQQKAAEYYNQVADFAEQAEGFDKESVEYFRKMARQLAG
jgi:uncharacterized protein YecA (UPF0149 family)